MLAYVTFLIYQHDFLFSIIYQHSWFSLRITSAVNLNVEQIISGVLPMRRSHIWGKSCCLTWERRTIRWDLHLSLTSLHLIFSNLSSWITFDHLYGYFQLILQTLYFILTSKISSLHSHLISKIQISLTLAVLISKIARIDYPKEWYAFYMIHSHFSNYIKLIL